MRILISALLGFGLLIACNPSPQTWPEVKAEIRERFPDVAQMTITDFIANHRSRSLVVDVRAPEEYAVSHLEGAVNLTNTDEVVSAFEVSGKEEIVLYCSVGYRSSRLAAEIQNRLAAPVYNLEGSIFEWANSGHPLFRGGEPVNKVHPYDPNWGRLLDPEHHP